MTSSASPESNVQHDPAPRSYAVVFVLLLALLVVTVAMAFVDLNRLLPGSAWSRTLALSIAAAKGLLIVLYFMHLKTSHHRTVMFAAAGFIWLAIFVTLTMSDYLTRQTPPGVNPKGEPRYLESADASASSQR